MSVTQGAVWVMITSSLFDTWIADANTGEMSDSDIARVAETLASSGDQLAFRPGSADLASTGGPGSISTLWAPAALVALGATVAKLGVPGRPAGGVDTLMQLNGYQTDLDAVEAEDVLRRCGYVHLLAGVRFAPADAAFFTYRQQVGAQNIPTLAIASLLSKKLATGISVAGLEIRVASHGNFGPDQKSAARNARRYCNVAKMLGITGICFLVDGSSPQQPYLGRGEALLAISRLLVGAECEWLGAHARECETWSASLTSENLPSRDAICRAFIENVSAQGGTIAELHERAAAVAAGHSRTIAANKTGHVQYDLGRLREAILKARHPDQALLFDDSVGLILLARPGSAVKLGTPLVSARCNDATWKDLRSAVTASIEIAQISGNKNNGSTVGVEVISV